MEFQKDSRGELNRSFLQPSSRENSSSSFGDGGQWWAECWSSANTTQDQGWQMEAPVECSPLLSVTVTSLQPGAAEETA